MKLNESRKGSRITIKDVARDSGFTANTVSRVLRNDAKITKATQDKILASAKRLGYVPNLLASTLRSGTSHIVAVIVNDLHNQHFTIMLSKIDEELRKAGYNMMVLCMQLNEELGERLIHIAVSHLVDGILYFPYHNNSKHIEYMQKHNMPFVLIDRWIQGVTADCVRCDDEMGGYLAGRHLIELGHKKFLRLAGVLASSSEIDRSKGLARALSEAGLSSDCVRVVPWEQSEEAIAEGSYDQIMMPLDYTAVFSFSDELAYHALNALNLLKVSIPEEVSLISFDHIHSGILYLPRLTSIYATEGEDVALSAVRMLLNRIKTPGVDPQTKIIQVKVYDEGTTASPRPLT